jgi:hypothetical protein
LDQKFFDEISQFTLRVCTPIYWHDRAAPFPKDVRGASCFFLRFDDRIIGVTADHVIDAYKNELERAATLVCQVRLFPFNLGASLIDRDHDLDIATFAVSESELTAMSAIPIDCRGAWPPPKPDRYHALSLAGFPEHLRVIHPDRWGEFKAYGALPAVEDVTDRDIIVTYDPKRDTPLRDSPLPPVGLNLSGCSGGPVLMHGIKNGLHRWFPVGLIIGGPRGEGSGENASFDIILARRIHHLAIDGSLDHPPSGWLPTPRRA